MSLFFKIFSDKNHTNGRTTYYIKYTVNQSLFDYIGQKVQNMYTYKINKISRAAMSYCRLQFFYYKKWYQIRFKVKTLLAAW